jgi:hypothetical protein
MKKDGHEGFPELSFERAGKEMIFYGPVRIAAPVGYGSAAFDLTIGVAVLALTWIGYFKEKDRLKISIWAAIGVTAICAVLIWSGVLRLLR